MKKFTLSLLVAIVLFLGIKNIAYAAPDVYLTVKNNGAVVYSGNIALPPPGMISINDSGGTPHSGNADSVLSILNSADILSPNFNISNLIYYSSFGAFYLKCINVAPSNNLCDNWQYKVNGNSPAMGMDSEILSGRENVVVYFGDDNTGANDGALGAGPLVANPPPGPDWLNPEEIPPTLPPPPVPENLPANKIAPVLSEKSSDQIIQNFAPTPKPETLRVEIPTSPTKISENIGKKIKIKKIESTASQNTATALNAVQNTDTIVAQQPPQKNWFVRFLDSIFGF